MEQVILAIFKARLLTSVKNEAKNTSVKDE